MSLALLGREALQLLEIKWAVTMVYCHFKIILEKETSFLCILQYLFLKNTALSISSDLTLPEAEILTYNFLCMANVLLHFINSWLKLLSLLR